MKKQVQIFKALGDETRLRIMLLLLNHGELCVCDLEASLDIPQSTVSRHLATLRNADLVEGQRCGMWMHYRIIDGSILGTAVLENLKIHCRQLRQIREDNQRLLEYLKSKKEDACAA